MDERDKKIWDLEQAQRLAEALEAEREEADNRYAIKITEKIVFGMFGLMGTIILGVLFKVAIDYIGHLLK